MFALKSPILALIAFSDCISAFPVDKFSIFAFITSKLTTLAVLTAKSSICLVLILSILEPFIVPLSVVILFTVSVVSSNSFCKSSNLSIVFAISQVFEPGSSNHSTVLTILCFSLTFLCLDIRLIVSPRE
ncbi:hypothetical protein HAHI6034_10845 [Hathewaya histolytica]